VLVINQTGDHVGGVKVKTLWIKKQIELFCIHPLLLTVGRKGLVHTF